MHPVHWLPKRINLDDTINFVLEEVTKGKQKSKLKLADIGASKVCRNDN